MDNNAYFIKLNQALESHTALWQATVVETDGSSPSRSGMKLAVPLDQPPFGNLGGGDMEHRVIDFIRVNQPQSPALHSFALAPSGSEDDIQTGMICGGHAVVFIEPLHLAEILNIIGAGHCGKALGHMAKRCGFYTCLIDNRSDIVAEIPPDSCHQAVVNDYTDISTAINFGSNSWVVIMTHGHLHDKEVLEQCLGKPFKYLGMIGSKTKVSATFAKLKEKGFTEQDIARCHAPVGMPIGSQTPDEIAVSILAQLIALRRGKL